MTATADSTPDVTDQESTGSSPARDIALVADYAALIRASA